MIHSPLTGAIAHAARSGHACARTIDAGDTFQPIAWERLRILSEVLFYGLVCDNTPVGCQRDPFDGHGLYERLDWNRYA